MSIVDVSLFYGEECVGPNTAVYADFLEWLFSWKNDPSYPYRALIEYRPDLSLDWTTYRDSWERDYTLEYEGRRYWGVMFDEIKFKNFVRNNDGQVILIPPTFGIFTYIVRFA